jgi:ABC-type dipeptide/oligopeptide/nickel transport system permease subunit
MGYKFGTKSQRKYSLGVKHQIHDFSKMGLKTSKTVGSISPMISLFAPEIGVPLGVAAGTGKIVSTGIERLTR